MKPVRPAPGTPSFPPAEMFLTALSGPSCPAGSFLSAEGTFEVQTTPRLAIRPPVLPNSFLG